MPIPIVCVCGRQFQVRDDLVGMQVQCPCTRVLTVPAPAAPAAVPRRPRAVARPAAAPSAPAPPPRSSVLPGILTFLVVLILLAGGGVAAFFLLPQLNQHSDPGKPTDQAEKDRDRPADKDAVRDKK